MMSAMIIGELRVSVGAFPHQTYQIYGYLESPSLAGTPQIARDGPPRDTIPRQALSAFLAGTGKIRCPQAASNDRQSGYVGESTEAGRGLSHEHSSAWASNENMEDL
jgi:hypothetical protein